MDDRIEAAAEEIRGVDGEAFVRLMGEAYQTLAASHAGHHFGSDFMELAAAASKNGGSDDDSAAQAFRRAVKLGLIKLEGGKPEFTSAGFLVGNVAKEYCYFVEQGRRLPPPVPPSEMFSGKDVLDVGCSFGRWLWGFQKEARSALGIEAQEEYVVLGRALSLREGYSNPNISVGSAESLDALVKPDSFDFVFSRLVLNYVNVRPVLRKMAAALRRRGTIWIQVESPTLLPRWLLAPRGSIRRKGFVMLAALNLPYCLLTGSQVSVSSKGRMHGKHNPVYLPVWWWRREFERLGLTDFHEVARGDSPVFYARKQL